jgi:uracil-DNA glycosylase
MEEPGDSAQWQPGSIMVVGQDFNSLKKYEIARDAGTEFGLSVTWRNLRPLLRSANVPLRSCFFTNVYMGLRDGGPETGRFAGSRDREFVNRCARFFERQLEFCKPRLILTLGLEPLTFLCRFIMNVPAPPRLLECNEIYRAVGLADGSTVVVVGLTHPCYPSNTRHRRYKSFTGRDAELAMIRDGLQAAAEVL